MQALLLFGMVANFSTITTAWSVQQTKPLYTKNALIEKQKLGLEPGNTISSVSINPVSKDINVSVYEYDAASGRRGNESVYYLNSTNKVLQSYQAMDQNSIAPYLVSYDQTGKTYFGTFFNGLWSMNPNSHTPVVDNRFPTYTRSGYQASVTGLHFDHVTHSLYVGYLYDPFYRLNSDNQAITTYNNTSIAEGADQHYISTDKAGDAFVYSAYGAIGYLAASAKHPVSVANTTFAFSGDNANNNMIYDKQGNAYFSDNSLHGNIEIFNPQIKEIKKSNPTQAINLLPVLKPPYTKAMYEFTNDLVLTQATNHNIFYDRTSCPICKNDQEGLFDYNLETHKNIPLKGLPYNAHITNLTSVPGTDQVIINTFNNGIFYADPSSTTIKPVIGIAKTTKTVDADNIKHNYTYYDAVHNLMYIINHGSVYNLNLKTMHATLFNQALSNISAQQMIVRNHVLYVFGTDIKTDDIAYQAVTLN